MEGEKNNDEDKDVEETSLTLSEAIEQGLAMPNLFHPEMDADERRKYTTTSGIVVGQAAHEVVQGMFNEELPYAQRVLRGGLGMAGLFEFVLSMTSTMHMSKEREDVNSGRMKVLQEKDAEIEELKKELEESKKKDK